jgi:anti-sigma-K factor RskA
MNEDLHALVGLYVVDALEDDERARFEDHLAGCDACATEVAEFRATAGRLTGLMAENPPPALRSAIMDRVAATRQLSPVGDTDELSSRRSRRARRILGPALAAAAAVVAVVLGLGWVREHRELDRQQAMAAVLTAPDAQTIDLSGSTPGDLRLVYSPSLDRSVVIADGLPDLPSDRAYALWFIGDAGPEEAGLFRTDAGRATEMLERTPSGYAGVGVTNEPRGGSATPTPPILMQAEVQPV